MDKNQHMRRAWAVAAIPIVLLGCSPTSRADKSGSDTVVLRLATIDSVNNNGQSYGPQAFVDGLAEVCEGRLQVEVIGVYGDGEANAESTMIEAIAAGDVDGGWPSTRAFAPAGISGLEAVEAPMTITSYDAEKALVSGSIAETVVERLEGSGVVGLGLAVGPLRRPFASAPALLGPDDWQGVRFRGYNSPVQADTIRALGGEPVDIGFGWIDQVNTGSLRGAEFDVAQYHSNGFATEAGHVTANVVLWPKVFVLAFSEKRFDALSGEQRDCVREAAAMATQASVDATYDEDTPARELCDRGVRFVSASSEQLDGLRAAMAPVIDALAADPLLAEIQALAADHPDPDVPDVLATCQEADAVADAGDPAIPEETSALPDGIYRTEITLADVEAAGLSNGSGWTGTWTLTIDDGTYQVTCLILDLPSRDCGSSGGFEGALDAGYLRGEGNTVFFVYDAALHSELTGCDPCFPAPVHLVTWSLDGDTLTLSDVSDPEWAAGLVIKPWTKIG